MGEDTVYFGRKNGRVVPILANEIRQILADYLTESSTDQNRPTNRDSILETVTSFPTADQYDKLRQPVKCTSPPPLQLLGCTGSPSRLTRTVSSPNSATRDHSNSAPTSRDPARGGSPPTCTPTLNLRKPRNVPRQTVSVQPFTDSDTGAVSPFTVPDVFGMADEGVQGRTEVVKSVRRGPPPLVSISKL